MSCEVNVLYAENHESPLQVDSIIFDGFGQACPKYSYKYVISLWHLKKEVKNEVRDLAALAGSNTTLTIYYTFHVLPPFTLFVCQYGIHTKLFLHVINYVFKISSTLFQVKEGLCRLPWCFCYYYSCFEYGQDTSFFMHWFSLMCQNIFSVCFSHGIAYVQPEKLTGRKWKTLFFSEAIAWYVKTFFVDVVFFQWFFKNEQHKNIFKSTVIGKTVWYLQFLFGKWINFSEVYYQM